MKKIKLLRTKATLITAFLAVAITCFGFIALPSRAQEQVKPSQLIEAGIGVYDVSDQFSVGIEQGSVDATGIKITTKNSSATFAYKHEINAETLNKDLTLMELQFLGDGAENYGRASNAMLWLTDADDPENKIGVGFYPAIDLGASNGAVTYFRVSYGGTTVGYDGKRLWEGHYGLCSYNRQLYPGKFSGASDLFNTYFDYSEKAFYVDTNEGKKVVLDIDNPDHLQGIAPWQGFKNDRCILSMDITYESSNESGLVVTKILGRDTSGATLDTENNVPALKIIAPVNYTTESLPKAEVGREYKLPDVNVFDFVYGDTDITITAERGGEDVSNEIANGYITPSEAGRIKLVYTATNADGKTASAEAYFIAVEKLPPYVYAKSHGNMPVFGEYFNIPEISVMGGTGNLEIVEKANYNGKTINLSESRKVLINEIGSINLSVTVEDYTGRVEESVFIYSISADKAIIWVEGMPTSAEKGTNLVIPNFDVFVQGDKNAKVYVGDTDVTESMQYQVTENKGSILKVKFCGGVDDKYSETVYDVRVVDSNYTLCDYFYATEGQADIYDSINDEAVVIETDNDATVKMAFPVSLQSLYTYFKFDGSFADSLDIVLTGYENRSEETFFRISYESANTSTIRINGKGQAYSLPVSFAGLSEYRLMFNNLDGGLYCNEEKVLNFDRFNARGVVLSFRINGVTAESKILVQRISNQSFHPGAFLMGDNVAPYVYIDGELNKYKAVYTVGAYQVLPAASAYDVLSSGATVKVTVTSPTDKTILEATADKKNYVQLNEYGVYVISYVAEDVNGFKSTFNYNVELIDRVKPSISVEEKPEDSYKVGDTLELSEYSVSDNFDKNPTVEIFLLNNRTFERKIVSGKSIYLGSAGSYTLIYKVSDSAFNSARVEYTFEVRG